MARLKGLFCSILLFFMLQPAVAGEIPGILIVTNSNGWPPFSFINEQGKPSGAMIDFWQEFGRRTGKKIEFQLTDWNDSLDRVRTGRAHIHAGLFRLKEREAYLDFTNSLRLDLTYRPFISHKLNVSKIQDLGNIPMGVVSGDSNESYIKTNYPSVKLKRYPTTEKLIKAALSEEILAFVADSMVTMHYIGKQGAQNQFYVIGKLYAKTYYAAVTKGNQSLLEYINHHMDLITEDEFDRIFHKWIPSMSKTPEWVIPALSGMLGVLFLQDLSFSCPS